MDDKMDTKDANAKLLVETSVEIKELPWEMKNFTKIATLKDSFTNLSHSLDAGQSIGLPTKWEFYLSQREDDFGIFFKLAENPTKAEEVLATFHVIIRLADGGEYRSLVPGRLSTSVGDDFILKYLQWRSMLTDLDETSDDKLTLDLKLCVYSKQTEDERKKQELAKVQAECQKQIGTLFSASFMNKNYTDVTLTTSDGVEFYAHKIILAAQSNVFEAMFTSDWDEKRTGIVTLEDIKSSGFSIVLKFMYSGEGDEAWTSCSEEVIYAADKESRPGPKTRFLRVSGPGSGRVRIKNLKDPDSAPPGPGRRFYIVYQRVSGRVWVRVGGSDPDPNPDPTRTRRLGSL
ncbi:Speckle-type POZ protein [Folsomia candida]|uniref:Speckle-type POZ protein n=1 Tax=Folsomia candida TaxID=158441 RepID=A0A226D6B4_FOLCA|nr:Speckle-type POZ protein [Folsomia candida]